MHRQDRLLNVRRQVQLVHDLHQTGPRHVPDAPWDVYPVAAEVRVLLDGKPLGEPLKIECKGLNGLYPDDVYDAVLR